MNNYAEDKPDTPNYKRKNGNKSGQYNKKEIKPPKKITERYLYNSGLAYLQRFPSSSMNFKSVMMRKINKSCRHHTEQNLQECIAMLEALVAQFTELSLLDDVAYLKGMVISLRRRGLSAAQITNKLMQKGYKRDDITCELKQHDQNEFNSDVQGDVQAALIFARKKKLGIFDVMKKRDPEKSLAMMARAGYSYDIAKKTLNITLEDLPEEFKSYI